MTDKNIYKPYLMSIESIIDEAPDVKTFRLKFINEEEGRNFKFSVGQFAEYSVMGEGESTFCIASPPTRKDYIECTFRKTGKVTNALARMDEGDIIGLRGPYGNIFPIEEWKGKNLLFIAGGIALPPMRCVIWNCLDNRADYKNITIVYGAKTVADLVYKHELKEWNERNDVKLITTVDPGGETPDWKGEVGFVPTVLSKLLSTINDKRSTINDQLSTINDKLSTINDKRSTINDQLSTNTIAIVCGPPIMIKFTFPVLENAGFKDEAIFTTLENRMKCGLGICGRCNIGKLYVCKDGPVFTFADLKLLPQEY